MSATHCMKGAKTVKHNLNEIAAVTLAIIAVLAVTYAAVIVGSSEAMVALVSLVGASAAFFFTADLGNKAKRVVSRMASKKPKYSIQGRPRANKYALPKRPIRRKS